MIYQYETLDHVRFTEVARLTFKKPQVTMIGLVVYKACIAQVLR